MTRRELAEQIIPKISDYLFAHGHIDQSVHNDADDNISMGKYDVACDELSVVLPYKRLLIFLKSSLANTDPIPNNLTCRILDVPQGGDKTLANFCYKSTGLSILPAKYLKFYMDNLSHTDEDIMGVVECILLKIKDDVHLLEEFLGYCHTLNDKRYCILTSLTPDKDWKQYAYAYFCYVNEKGFPRPVELDFVSSTKFAPAIVFDQANNYEQYFDAYGVMSEAKYAEDVLIRYLRMYQVIEYFAFRKVLADMTKGNLRENGFVRQVLAVVKKGSSNEYDEISKGLKAMFPDPNKLNVIIPRTDYTPAETTFLKDRLKIDISYYDENTVCRIIYQLRNCIVHNKESELHFSFYNVSDYQDCIGILRNYISKLEPALVTLINDHSRTVLEFDKPSINLY